MLRSCGVSLAALLPFLLGYVSIADGALSRRLLVALPVAAVTWLGVMALLSMRFALRESRAVRRAVAGAPPRDGQWTAAFGRLASPAEPLRSPFAGEECAAYEYKVGYRADSPGQMHKVELRGYGMTACHVETRHGAIALRGFPDLDSVPWEVNASAEARERARLWLETTEFEVAPLSESMRLLQELYQSDSASIRKDWKDSERRLDLAELDLVEHRLKLGVEVCALGRYSAAKQALLGDFRRGEILEVKDPAVLRAPAALGRDLAWRAVLGVLLIGVANAGFWWSQARVEAAQSWEAEAAQQQALAEAVRSGDLERVRELATLERIDSWDEGTHGDLVSLTRDAETVRLLAERGAALDIRDSFGQTALHRAVDRVELELARALVEAGAEVNSERTNDGETPLWTALDGWEPALVELLLEAGATDDRVSSGEGHPLASDSAALELCHLYVEAIHRGDGDRVRSLSTATHAGQWSLFAEELLSRVPTRFESIEGFESQGRATVRGTGPSPSGRSVVVTFQLVDAGDGWRVHREAGELQSAPARP